MASEDRQIVVGITVSEDGHAQIDPTIVDEIFGIALLLDESLDHPVDVQHIVAAIVLASEEGRLPQDTVVRAEDDSLRETIKPHVETVFRRWQGDVGSDDE